MKRGCDTLGIIGGYDGLLPPQNFRVLDYKALDGLLVRGGTILGTANRGRFSAKTGYGGKPSADSMDATTWGTVIRSVLHIKS
jgi:6-phosphofructokinase